MREAIQFLKYYIGFITIYYLFIVTIGTCFHEFGHYFFGSILFHLDGNINFKIIELIQNFSFFDKQIIGEYVYSGGNILTPLQNIFLGLGGVIFDFLLMITSLMIIIKAFKNKNVDKDLRVAIVTFVLIYFILNVYTNIIEESTTNDGVLVKENILMLK